MPLRDPHQRAADLRDAPSVPTRRSSDLPRDRHRDNPHPAPSSVTLLQQWCPGRGRSTALSPPPSPDDTSCPDRKSTRLNSSHVAISYAVLCLKKKTEDDAAAVAAEGRDA